LTLGPPVIEPKPIEMEPPSIAPKSQVKELKKDESPIDVGDIKFDF
jgi:hypothetical protein